MFLFVFFLSPRCVFLRSCSSLPSPTVSGHKAMSALSELQQLSDRSRWEDGHQPCLPFPAPPAPGHPRPLIPSSLEYVRVYCWSWSHCCDSLLSQNPDSCFLPPTWLHIQQALPVDTASMMPLTYPALGTPCPCQPGGKPQGSITPWVASSKASAFQLDTRQGLRLQLQHPAWRVLSPSTPPAPAAVSLLCSWQ